MTAPQGGSPRIRTRNPEMVRDNDVCPKNRARCPYRRVFFGPRLAAISKVPVPSIMFILANIKSNTCAYNRHLLQSFELFTLTRIERDKSQTRQPCPKYSTLTPRSGAPPIYQVVVENLPKNLKAKDPLAFFPALSLTPLTPRTLSTHHLLRTARSQIARKRSNLSMSRRYTVRKSPRKASKPWPEPA